MNQGSRRDRTSATARALPLAIALALGVAAGEARALTTLVPGAVPPSPARAITREDGTPLRAALGAWHADAAQNMTPPSQNAIVRTVVNCDDDGPGSLRQTLRETASGDTVDLSQLACSRISLTSGGIAAPVDTVTIVGPASRAFTIDGNDADRVLLHYGAGGLLLKNLMLTRGRHVATGTDVGVAGCLASAGYVTLDHSTVSNCAAVGEGAYGGCVYAYSLILASSTLSGCDALGTHPTNGTAAFGGAAFVYQIDLVESTVTNSLAHHLSGANPSSYDIGGGIMSIRGGLVIDSTIDSNRSEGRGGGIAVFDDLTVRNSTISGNAAIDELGGGVFVRQPAALDVLNSTISANRAPDGAGVFTTSARTTLRSTIIAGNTASSRGFGDFSASRTVAVDGSRNLLVDAAPNVTLPPDTISSDPQLMPLANNGGATRTHALRNESPGIDAGTNDDALASDQRGEGYPRVVGSAADIGAFEYDGAPSGSVATATVPTLGAWAIAALVAVLALVGAIRTAPSRARSRRRP